MLQQPKKKVVIAGGGTAGWMAAAALAKVLGKNLEITLVESDEIGTVGVGEATIPTMAFFHQLLDIPEAEFMAATQATFKLGIQFENWRQLNHDYIHSFGMTGKDCWAAGFQHFWLKGRQLGFADDFASYCPELMAAKANKFGHIPHHKVNYAYHLDASRYAVFLRNFSEKLGVKRVEGRIAAVLQHDNGDIRALQLTDDRLIEGALFLDCTGFRALLIERTLHVGFHDWSHWLPMDRALAVQTTATRPPVPYTRSIAHQHGWQWQIPLQTRVGNGLVYCSQHCSDDEAHATLFQHLSGEPLTSAKPLQFKTGLRRKQWHRNCIAVGLASGFLEPLESTSIHLIQQNIIRLLRLFPHDGVQQADIDEFNQQATFDVERIRDFIILHYHVTERRDSPFWRHCAAMDIPATLQHKIDLFRQTGRVFRDGIELFDVDSWMQVMLGQGVMPTRYHPIVDMMSEQELQHFLAHLRHNVDQLLAKLPQHASYLQQYCWSELSKLTKPT